MQKSMEEESEGNHKKTNCIGQKKLIIITGILAGHLSTEKKKLKVIMMIDAAECEFCEKEVKT